MAIDLDTERLIQLKDVPNHLPTRNGRKWHVASVYRAVQRGDIETIKVFDTMYTSVEAIRRFIERRSARPRGSAADMTNAPATRSPAARRKASERAAAELIRMGA